MRSGGSRSTVLPEFTASVHPAGGVTVAVPDQPRIATCRSPATVVWGHVTVDAVAPVPCRRAGRGPAGADPSRDRERVGTGGRAARGGDGHGAGGGPHGHRGGDRRVRAHGERGRRAGEPHGEGVGESPSRESSRASPGGAGLGRQARDRRRGDRGDAGSAAGWRWRRRPTAARGRSSPPGPPAGSRGRRTWGRSAPAADVGAHHDRGHVAAAVGAVGAGRPRRT